MRNELTQNLLLKSSDKDFIFLTGDLGFMALEPLKESLGERFINAGVAEQNMISVAAGLAQSGLKPWVYSIAPFVYARPFEQIRNDICLHELPVVLVGNGGGYGYGIMGPTHHAIDDYGALLGLNSMNVYIPAFVEDLTCIINLLFETKKPSYLRLGVDKKPKSYKVKPYSTWRHLYQGERATLLFIGPIVSEFLKIESSDHNCSVWLLSKLSNGENILDKDFIQDVQSTRKLLIVEEHLEHGSAASMITYEFCKRNIHLEKFIHLCAKGYPSGKYGSQSFHQKESNIDSNSIFQTINELIN
ncbi:transketolase [Fluviispira sanaruensis]|uniref:Transketolase n=1 Tax=Fluviispira sanaruensis TaxID=2493639 RepID=A0A4P2VPU2_FLUSA|nr:transketolase [Fluviispira sanaruensis]BBH53879.1 transketolase [Fluviispira sanaruensis]